MPLICYLYWLLLTCSVICLFSSHHRPSSVNRPSSKLSSTHVRQSHGKVSAVLGSGKTSKGSLLLKHPSSGMMQDQLERTSSELIAVVSPRPGKRKVIETEVEPSYVEGSQSTQAVEMCFSAVVDFCKFELKERRLQFQDTLMFESRFCK